MPLNHENRMEMDEKNKTLLASAGNVFYTTPL